MISSATLDAEEMKAFFETNTTDDPKQDTAAIISIEGRTFPVGILMLVLVLVLVLALALVLVLVELWFGVTSFIIVFRDHQFLSS